MNWNRALKQKSKQARTLFVLVLKVVETQTSEDS